MTYNPLISKRLEAVNVTDTGSAYTVPDVNQYTAHRLRVTANCTFTFPAPAAGKNFAIQLVQDDTGGRTVTWPSSVRWTDGTAPTLSTGATAIDEFSFRCYDGTKFDATSARPGIQTVKITSAAYAALSPKLADVLYIVVG